MNFLSFLFFSSIVLAILSCFFWLLLSKETLFKCNRVVLIFNMLLALLLPLLPTMELVQPMKEKLEILLPKENLKALVLTKASTIELESSNKATELSSLTSPTSPTMVSSQWDDLGLTFILTSLYWTGVLILLARLLIQLVSIKLLIRKSEVMKTKQYQLVSISKDIAPFSFGKSIFLNPKNYSELQMYQIISHEKIHINHYHSVDLILGELFSIFQWFNPFVWLHRNLVIQNLEFLVDDEMLSKGEDKKTYQYNLLETTVPNYPLSIATNFNQLLIKKRIMMMNQKKSSLSITYKYFLLMPLIFVLFVFSSQASQKDINPISSSILNTKSDLERVYVFVSNAATPNELKILQQELKEHGYTIRFEKLVYKAERIAEVEAVFFESSEVIGISEFSSMRNNDFIFFKKEKDTDTYGTEYDIAQIQRIQENDSKSRIFKAGVSSSEEVLNILKETLERKKREKVALNERRFADPNWKGNRHSYYSIYDQVDAASIDKIKEEIENTKGEVRYYVEGIEWDAADAMSMPVSKIEKIVVGHEQYKKVDKKGQIINSTPWNLEIKIQTKID